MAHGLRIDSTFFESCKIEIRKGTHLATCTNCEVLGYVSKDLSEQTHSFEYVAGFVVHGYSGVIITQTKWPTKPKAFSE